MTPVDQRLIAHYGTLSLLGSGGMGTVYRAYDAQRGHDVAIKQVDTRAPILLARLRREAQVLARLSHPHVCPLLEWREEGDSAWIVMPVVEGQTLGEISSKLTIEQVVQLLVQACEGVEAVHAAGLVHRDLKPSNIMVAGGAGDLSAVVMDFGIARVDSETTLTGTHEVLGTPAYMAPEQARGEAASVDVRADVWGLGATLYHALTGAPPFGQGSLAQVMARVLDDDVASPRVHRSEIPEGLARICLKALERSLSRRYADVAALRMDLQRYQQGSAVVAPHPGPGFYLRRMWARHPRFWSGLAGLALALFGVAGWALWTAYSSAERAAAARELAGLSARVSAGMRAARLAPAHDINEDRAPLLADITALRRRYQDAAAEIRLDLDRALTDAYLALGQLNQARPHAQGLIERDEAPIPDRLRFAEVALSQHLQALPAAMNLSEGDRQLRIDALRAAHLQPALSALGERPLPPALTLRLALIESDWGAAESALEAYQSRGAGDYQRPFLAAELAFAQAAQRMQDGDLDAAQAQYETADTAYRQALQIARSEPAVLNRLCQLSAQGQALSSIRGQLPLSSEPSLDPSCEQLQLVDPGADDTDEAVAAAWYALASAADRRNQTAQARLAAQQAITVASGAVQRDPARISARLQLAQALSLDGALIAEDFAAAKSQFDRAIAQLNAARVAEPNNLLVLVALGDSLRNRGKRSSNQGSPEHTASGLADYAAARTVLEQAVALRPQAMAPRRALSLTLMFSFYAQRADQQRARALAVAAIAALDPLLEAYPEHPDLLFDQAANLGDYWHYLASNSADDELTQTLATLDRALALFGRLRAVAPARPDGYEFELGFRAQAGENLRVAQLPGAAYLEPVPALIAAAQAAELKLAEQYVGWALTERALALAADPDHREVDLQAAFADALAILERGLADPQRRYESVRMLLQWTSARARLMSTDDPRRAVLLARGETLFTQAADSERGQFDNILWCEGALVAYESRHQTPLVALRTALTRLDHCAEHGPVYFNRWLAARQRIAAELQSAESVH